MYFHWRFDKNRHGFPHSANLRHIIEHGYWEKLNQPNFIISKNKRNIANFLIECSIICI